MTDEDEDRLFLEDYIRATAIRPLPDNAADAARANAWLDQARARKLKWSVAFLLARVAMYEAAQK